MIKDNNAPQEQPAQEEALPESLDHEDLEASEMESISGGRPMNYTVTCADGSCLSLLCPSTSCVP